MANPATQQGGDQTVTLYMTVKDAAKAIDFYRKAFGATELYRLTQPDGKVGHAEIMIGNTKVMLSDEYPEYDALSPLSIGGTSVKLNVAVPDADAAVDKAVKAGAVLTRPVKTEFYGYRSGSVKDPFGFVWFLATQVEEVAPDEMQRRWNAMFQKSKTA
jgi:PhnB protein